MADETQSRPGEQQPALKPPMPTLMLSPLLDIMLNAQRAQLDAFSGFQRSWMALNKDMWDRWTCRFGGGIPLDG
jgi:hypothetical protein